MLSYLTSIIIWAVILFTTATILTKKLLDNGWIDGYVEPDTDGKINLVIGFLVISMIPIFRVLVLIAIIRMAIVRKKD